MISLETELGRRRREGIGLEGWTLSPGVLPHEVPDLVRRRWYPGRMSGARNARLQGAFSAHLRAWEALAAEGSPEAVILEDDALFLRDIPEQLPSAMTLLGGVFCGFGRWADNDAFVRSGEFVAELAGLAPGVNELPSRGGARVRWIMAVAYYLPRGMAAELVEAARSSGKKDLRSPDVWLNRFATHCVWPPCFGDQGSESQCMTGADYHGSDLYCNRRMFRVAERLGLLERLRALAV